MKIVKMSTDPNIEQKRLNAIEAINSSDCFIVGYRKYKGDIYGWCIGDVTNSEMIVVGNLISNHGLKELDKD